MEKANQRFPCFPHKIQEKAYLKCKISEGMFPDEYTVETKLHNGTEISGFFPESCVKENTLEVEVCGKIGNKVLIMPPICSDGFLGNVGSYIWVNTNQLI